MSCFFLKLLNLLLIVIYSISNSFQNRNSKSFIYLRYKNYHISPTEIENIVQEHPNVAESQVFGKKDPYVQELVSIAVVPKENKQVM